jgi:hypothetical protein
MRLILLVFTAISGLAAAAPLSAQQTQPSPSADTVSSPQDPAPLPVSLDKIKVALEQTPAVPVLRGLNETPHFKVEIHERSQFTLEDFLKTMDVKPGPIPAGGLYGYEQQRQMFPATDYPLRQPYAAFSQSELLTILIENLAGKYLANRAINSITAAERAHAEAAAREEVRRSIAEYCAAQPNSGAGIQICAMSPDNR